MSERDPTMEDLRHVIREEQIKSDIEDDVITDPDTDLSADPRWPA